MASILRKTKGPQSDAAFPPADDLIKRIFLRRDYGTALGKFGLALLVAIQGINALRVNLLALEPPYVYQKDFVQEYLLGKAVLTGTDPYLPLPELAARIASWLPEPVFPHPTPHPPPVAILCLPLALLSYEQAAVVWFGFEIACIWLAVFFFMGELRPDRSVRPVRSRLRRSRIWPVVATSVALMPERLKSILRARMRPGSVVIALLALGWSPVREELSVGQIMLFILVLLIGAWLALRAGDAIRGGTWLGCVVALKLIGWPLIIFLLLRRNWRAAGAAIAVPVLANFAAGWLMGFDKVADYYLKIGSSVWAIYRAYAYNFSLWSVGWRLFEGTGSPVFHAAEAPPLVTLPMAAQMVSYALPLALLVFGLVLATRARSFDTAFGLLICVSILVSPLAWSHYLTLAAIPAVIVARRLFALDWPRRETYLAAMIALSLSSPSVGLNRMALLFAVEEPVLGNAGIVPFAASLITLIPAVALLGLFWLVWHSESV
ncbi:MAG: hypothetical protein A2Z04_05845 [Chloroflexi bacterium RBG_16_57_9]|nr:MAG: hypothetical protein A2Z04_05845 [Chloroflexi bacterium RBG_16_57_9]